MTTSTEAANKSLVLEAFDTLFKQRDYAAAGRFWSPGYIQHSAQRTADVRPSLSAVSESIMSVHRSKCALNSTPVSSPADIAVDRSRVVHFERSGSREHRAACQRERRRCARAARSSSAP
ncbi:hypothetical protein [Caballeronia novacaledonica]|uniref:hypothetical protein n=1 Tax=Caballeronia novacaledonica TaxID=1544861 RepID=UPI000D132533|nr:hypothetical protein [Caballeronia novacaledonica]